jgi:hypothetical protein
VEGLFFNSFPASELAGYCHPSLAGLERRCASFSVFPIRTFSNTLLGSMIVNFQFTLDDYRNAFRGHFQKGASAFTRWMLKLVLVVGVLFLLLSVLFVITGQRALNVVLPPFLLGAFWIWIGMGKTYLLSARSQFAKNPILREPRR